MADVLQKPTVEEIVSKLNSDCPCVNVTRTETRRVYATAPRENSFQVCKYIHDNLTFEHCSTVIGVDYVDHMTVVYHLTNYYTGVMIELSVDIPADDLHIESVTPI